MRPQMLVGEGLADLHGVGLVAVQRLQPVIFRLEIVCQIVRSEADMMRRHRLIVESGPDTEIGDAGPVHRLVQRMPIVLITLIAGNFLLAIADLGTVTSVETGKFSEQLVTERIGPSGGRDQVSPAHIGVLCIQIALPVVLILRLQRIIPVVEAQIHPALLTETVVDAGVQVMESIPDFQGVPVLLLVVDNRHCRSRQHIQPGTAEGDIERGMIFPDRPLQVQVAGDKPQRGATVELFHIPLLRLYIDDGGQASAVASRESRLKKVHPLDRFIVEGGEKAADMVHLIDRVAVDQEQVLIRITAPDIQAGDTFRPNRHTGCQLQGTDDIGLAH